MDKKSNKKEERVLTRRADHTKLAASPLSPVTKLTRGTPHPIGQNKSNRNQAMERITFNFVFGERGVSRDVVFKSCLILLSIYCLMGQEFDKRPDKKNGNES